MLKWMLAAGAAALAITAPVAAQKGHAGGKEHGQQAKGQKGGGQKADRGDRGGGNDRAMRGPQRAQKQGPRTRSHPLRRPRGQRCSPAEASRVPQRHCQTSDRDEYLAAHSCDSRGTRAKAIDALERYLEARPDSEHRQSIRERLLQLRAASANP